MSAGGLEVLVLKARKLKNKSCFLMKMDPYALIHYGNQEQRSAVAKGQGRNPVWNERLIFRAEYPHDEIHKYKLIIKIMDRRKHSPDIPLGETNVYLKDLVSYGIELGKADMRMHKYRVVLPDQRYYGEVSVAISFTLDEDDHNHQLTLQLSKLEHTTI